MRLMGQWIRQEVEMTLEGYQDGDAVLRDLQLSKEVDLRVGRIIFAVPRQLKGVRAVFEMDDLARYMLLGVFDSPLGFISSLMRTTSIFFAREWKYLDIFDKEVVPENWSTKMGIRSSVGVYRRWRCSTMAPFWVFNSEMVAVVCQSCCEPGLDVRRS